MQKVTIHTDGSCLGNPGPGGWAAVLKLDDQDYRKEFAGGYKLTTNNRMEILAVVEALSQLPTLRSPNSLTQNMCATALKSVGSGVGKKRAGSRATKSPLSMWICGSACCPCLQPTRCVCAG